jgi:hypothetical protein
LQSLRPGVTLTTPFPQRKFISFATATPALLQHRTSTRRPANLEISVLPSSNHIVITNHNHVDETHFRRYAPKGVLNSL